MKRKVLILVLIGMLLVGGLFAGGQKEAEDANDNTLSVYVSTNVEEFPKGLDENNNFIIDYIREKTGYNVDWEIQPSSNVTEKISIMMASGEAPDIIETVDKALFAQLAYQGVLTPLEDLLKSHGQNLLKEIPEMAWKGVTFNGKIVGIPLPQNMVDSTFGLLIRKDWLDNLSLTVPRTTEELYKVMIAFKESDPSGNGTIPLTGANVYPEAGAFEVIRGAFGVDVEYALDGNDVIATMIGENNKRYLEYMAKCFEEGLIDPDYVVNKAGNIKEKLVGGKAGMAIVPWWDAFSIVPSAKELNPEADFIYIAPPVGPDGDSGITANAPIKKYFFIPSFSKKAKEAVSFLNKMTDPEIIRMVNYGKEGVHHTVEDGIYVPTEKISEIKWQVYYNVWDSRDSFLNRIKYKGFWPYYKQMTTFPQNEDIYKYAPPIEAVESVKSTLEDLHNEYSSKIIMGVLPVDSFEEFVEKYKQLGGVKALDEIQAWYDSVK